MTKKGTHEEIDFDTESKLTQRDLEEMWKRPYERQIAVAQAKIIEAIVKSNGRVQISWSGGKDSTFLLYLYCMIISDMEKYSYPKVDVIFADTTNETKGIYDFIDFYPEWLEKKFPVKINLRVIYPEANGLDKVGRRIRVRTSMVETVKRVGVPLISKEYAGKIDGIRTSMRKSNINFDLIANNLSPSITNRDYLFSLGLTSSAVNYLIGWNSAKNAFSQRHRLPQKYIPFLKDDAPKISERCCNILKVGPIKRVIYSGHIGFDGVSMVGTVAQESARRITGYLMTGCNGGIDSHGVGVSKPLGAMSLQAVLWGIRHFNIPLAADYGEITETEHGLLQCTGEHRTGCVLCGFGIMYDWDRFVRLQKNEPAKIRYAFTPVSEGGLGFLEACEYLNKHCKGKVVIPKV